MYCGCNTRQLHFIFYLWTPGRLATISWNLKGRVISEELFMRDGGVIHGLFMFTLIMWCLFTGSLKNALEGPDSCDNNFQIMKHLRAENDLPLYRTDR